MFRSLSFNQESFLQHYYEKTPTQVFSCEFLKYLFQNFPVATSVSIFILKTHFQIWDNFWQFKGL